MIDGGEDEGGAELLDLDRCAAVLQVRRRRLRRWVRRAEFAEPAGLDGALFWRRADVWRWAARQGPPLAALAPLTYWPTAASPADYLGATRRPSRNGADDVVMMWSAPGGRVAVIWRSSDPIMLRLEEEVGIVEAEVLVAVDCEFGVDGPGVRGINAARPNAPYHLAWLDLSRVVGQPMPYWPHALRDPDLLIAWHAGAATVTAPARPELDTAPLLRMAAMFDPDHATHRTLDNLARMAQRRATCDAHDELATLDRCLSRLRDSVTTQTTVVAARPLEIDCAEPDPDELDETTRRIGWLELLPRDDMLTWECVRQALMWDGGRHLPFSNPTYVDVTTPTGREWFTRLQPVVRRTAEFAHLERDGEGEAFTDPATGAPVMCYSDGRVRTSVPQRLPATNELAELILDQPIWVRTTDGTLYPLSQSSSYRSSWGHGGGGSGNLAVIINQLLRDITAEASYQIGGAPEGMVELTRLEWPRGTVLSRDLLEAARDGRPYHHPGKPAGDE